MAKSNQNLVITFSSPDRPGIVETITRAVVENGGNWEESRLARLCGDFAGIARIIAPTESVGKLTAQLQSLPIKDLHITVRVAQDSGVESGQLAKLTCHGADHEGIVNRISAFLAAQNINVEEMESSIEPAPITGTPTFNMWCEIRLPGNLDASELAIKLAALGSELAVDINLTA